MDFHNVNFFNLITGYPLLLLALTVHECAHAWTADKLGDPTARFLGRVTLNPIPHIDILGTVIFPILGFFTSFPLIGWAKPVPVNPLHFKHLSRDNMLVSLAGPAANVLLSIVFLILYAFIKHTGVLSAANSDPGSIVGIITLIIEFGIVINALLAVFNIIPIPPLDGSHVLEHLLPYKARQVYARIQPFGFILIYLLAFSQILFYLFLPVLFVIKLVMYLI